VIAAAREAQREPVERAAAGREVRFELDGPRPVVDRPVDGRPASVVQRRRVHPPSRGPGVAATRGRHQDDNGRDDGRPPRWPRRTGRSGPRLHPA